MEWTTETSSMVKAQREQVFEEMGEVERRLKQDMERMRSDNTALRKLVGDEVAQTERLLHVVQRRLPH